MLRYATWGTKNRSVKTAKMTAKLSSIKIKPSADSAKESLSLADCELFVEKKRNDLVEVERTCDGEFMTSVVDRIGAAVRKGE